MHSYSLLPLQNSASLRDKEISFKLSSQSQYCRFDVWNKHKGINTFDDVWKWREIIERAFSGLLFELANFNVNLNVAVNEVELK